MLGFALILNKYVMIPILGGGGGPSSKPLSKPMGVKTRNV